MGPHIEQSLQTVNLIHDVFMRQIIAIAQRSLLSDGLQAPCPYAFLLFGSGGRSERTWLSDQDHGIVYRDDSAAASRYFGELARVIEDTLNAVGYPPCEGKVTATNPEWRRSRAAWINMLAARFADESWESVRTLLIVADMRFLHGDEGLADELQAEFRARVRETPGILRSMLRNTLRHKAVLGPLGNLICEAYGTDAGSFDVKYGAYIPIVNAARLLAVQHEISAVSTLDRLDHLSLHVNCNVVELWKDAFRMALEFRSQSLTTKGHLSRVQLTKATRSKLKACILIGEQLQKYVQRNMPS